MSKQSKKDLLIGGGVAVLFFGLLIASRTDPLTDEAIGAMWCRNQGLDLSAAYLGSTSRPAYHTGIFDPQTKFIIICKDKLLH